MTERGLQEVVTPIAVSDGAGVRLERSIATRRSITSIRSSSSITSASENPNDYIAGFPMHPHRGIETMTYMLDGSVAHRDSIGNSGVIGAGDVQWMTAGSGILHEEMPKVGPRRPRRLPALGEPPRQAQDDGPRYQDVPAAQHPRGRRAPTARASGSIAGEVRRRGRRRARDLRGPGLPRRRARRRAGASSSRCPRGHTALLYVFQGEVMVGGPPRRLAAPCRRRGSSS